MTLINELIHIPDQVKDGDFVLKLAEGVEDDHARATVDDYVVTPGITDSLGEALGLISGAIEGDSSQAAYLHGSFGSGKSHFMAILHLLLSRNEHALAKAELHPAYAPWADKLADKKILLVPMHFLAAKSMDSEIFGQYVQHVQHAHPDAALPSVYLNQQILTKELPQQRELVGEDKFLTALNGDAEQDDDWDDEFVLHWTSEIVDQALAADATSQESRDLTAAFIAAFRAATPAEARATGDGFIDIDNGLSALSHHAKKLGYDAIVLFLDELILWLASKIGDMTFVQTETAKLTKLVESSNHDRPVPIISFVARQRDLNELVGEHVIGAELKALSDNLALQTGRFGTINLEDRDLAVIAKARVLAPVNDNAGTLLAGGADQALAGRDEIQRALAGSDADLALFRSVYPFTPALVETLIAVSEALQRERTALKVMLQMLVDHRDTLELGEFLPVGDLWNVVAAKDEPFSAELLAVFKRAKNLYRTKIRPMLCSEHSVEDDAADENKLFVRDDRILKTVLLAALVPQVDAFTNLSASKLVALNWGSVKSPIPGEETTVVANQLRRWATQLGELTVTDDPRDPVATVALVNVDTDEILRSAVQSFDTTGARRRAIKDLVVNGLGAYVPDGLEGEVAVVWRGTERRIHVAFGNLRDPNDLADSTLKSTPTRPKLLIDFPFDEPGYGPDADLERLDSFRTTHEPTPTLCWLPSFLTEDGQKQLRNFVALDMLLTGERFDQHTTHLSESQRREAKPLLTEQRNQLRSQLNDAVRAAYGVVGNHPYVDSTRSLSDHFVSLDSGMTVRPSTAPTFEGAFEQLYDQLFSSVYPGHPKLGDKKISRGNRQSALAELMRALGDPEGRVVVDTPKRAITKLLAEELELGTLAESNLVINKTWYQRLERHLNAAAEEGRSLNVGDLRELIESESGGPRGMPAEIADLIIAVVAAQADHSFVHAGLAIVADSAGALPSDTMLRRQELPSEDAWTQATRKAVDLFGVNGSQLVSAPEVARFAGAVKEKAASQLTAADDLYVQLQSAERTLGEIEDGARFQTAAAARTLVQDLGNAKEPVDVIDVLVGFSAPSSDQAVANSLSTAPETSAALAGANWTLITAFPEGPASAARDALRKDQLTDALGVRLTTAEAEATRLATERTPASPAAPAATPVVETLTSEGGAERPSTGRSTHHVKSVEELDAVVAEVRTAVEGGATVTIDWSATD